LVRPKSGWSDSRGLSSFIIFGLQASMSRVLWSIPVDLEHMKCEPMDFGQTIWYFSGA
jgi:hypothetical protein